MPFFMVFSEDKNIQQFLIFVFEKYLPFAKNSIIKTFRGKYPNLKIVVAKEYMGVMLFIKEMGMIL
jgi:hypothetical protein